MPSKKISQKIEGLRELGGALKELSSDVSKRIIYSATLKASQVIAKRASQLAPVSDKPHKVGKNGPTVQPGNLSKNIVTKRRKQIKNGLAAYEVVWKSKKKSDPFYGLFAEFGTTSQAAKPFMRPAFDQTKDEALNVMIKTLSKRIERANKKVK
jgi:HK97 gp10 family phage protein